MAAPRLNVPTILVACGYHASGSYRGTANTMHLASEALGMALPGPLR